MELGLSLGNSRGEEEPNNLGLSLKGSSDQLGEDLDDLDHSSSDPSLRLHLHPLSPAPRHTQPPPLRFPWLADNLSSESEGGRANREAEEQSSPNSGTSSFMEFSLHRKGERRESGEEGGGGERTDDEAENGSSTRKKLRLSKDQSAFLEESFKEHHTLNPKQKLELAKQLNLRPRQVEVWFQNRRARTKLKQTEVDCEYLKRCCETLTEENRRLQKELQELRALKTSQPFFMSLPATTLTMCPSCERVAPTTTTTTTMAAATADSNTTLSLGKPKPMLPFSQTQQAPS